MGVIFRCTAQIDLLFTDGLVCEDNTYEVAADMCRTENGWAMVGLEISAPDGLVDTSRADRDSLPSNWIDVSHEALSEVADDLWAETDHRSDSDGDEDMHPSRMVRLRSALR